MYDITGENMTAITVNKAIFHWFLRTLHIGKHLFLLPSRQTGKQLIDEATKLVNEWLQD